MEGVPFEEAVGAKVVLAAFEENPLHVAAAGFAFDCREHLRAKPGGTLRRFDSKIGERGKADTAGKGPFDDRGADQRAVGRARHEQAAFVVQIVEVLDEAVVEVATPADAVVAQAALDLAMAYVSGIAADDAREEVRDRFGCGGFTIPSENRARIAGPRTAGALVATFFVLVSQSPISVHCI